jgi:hypothetical protein
MKFPFLHAIQYTQLSHGYYEYSKHGSEYRLVSESCYSVGSLFCLFSPSQQNNFEYEYLHKFASVAYSEAHLSSDYYGRT